jgi:hypothetical protein
MRKRSVCPRFSVPGFLEDKLESTSLSARHRASLERQLKSAETKAQKLENAAEKVEHASKDGTDKALEKKELKEEK